MGDTVVVPGSPNAEATRGRGRAASFATRLLTAVPLVVAVAALSVALWNARATRKAVDGLEWTVAANADSASANRIRPDVGTIQFLRSGYSIQLESVAYNANGMYLAGCIGNPTNLWLSNLTIRFTARPPFYLAREAFMKAAPDSFERLYVSADKIGSAQTKPIARLGPGTCERFDVTVPNVKQTKDGVDVRVSFTGERYSYGP